MGASKGEESCWDLCCDPPTSKQVEVVKTDDEKRKDQLLKDLGHVEEKQKDLDRSFMENIEALEQELLQEKGKAQKELEDTLSDKKELEKHVYQWKTVRDIHEDDIVNQVRVPEPPNRMCSTGCAMH